MRSLNSWVFEAQRDNGVLLRTQGNHLVYIDVAEAALFHISILRGGKFRLARSWCIAPKGVAPWEGRHRHDLSGFDCPDFSVEHTDNQLSVATKKLRLTVHQPLQFVWEVWVNGSWKHLAADRPVDAYMLGARDHRHAHFMTLDPDDRIFGLGEKSGPLERTGRRYEMRNLDALGYDAARTDPLYKHIPFTLTRTRTAGCYGLFYDNLATSWFDLGNERDNYHGRYRSYRAEDGDLDYWFSWAPDIAGCTKIQQAITGGTALPPRWSLGYSGSTMAYTEAPDAQVQLEGFLEKIELHHMACDSFQMSSGYSSKAGKRYVFTWNHEKVPNPSGLAQRFSQAGVRLLANVKPVLLHDHPDYADAAKAGLFIKSAEGTAPASLMFWDDHGAHLDFTNPETLDWWRQRLRTQLLEYGITASWNDNNECEIWDETARAAGFGQQIEIGLIRPLMSLLMTRASAEAQVAHSPFERPFLITRSGCPGLQRYAQTWTGDNFTSWDSLRWNIRMGLGLSLSGIYNIGHDVGGFTGPAPGPELLLRWVQNGIFHPRFTIHSWNDDTSVTEPWMHPEVTDKIRDAIALRYRLLPYFYTLLWQSASQGTPMLRPVFLDHEHDERCFEDTNDFMLGSDLLVANVVSQGAQERQVYLPKNAHGWVDFHNGQHYAGGQLIQQTVTLDSIPLFVRAGAVVPLANATMRADPAKDTKRQLALFPAPGVADSDSWLYEDDGLTTKALQGDHTLTKLRLTSDTDTIHLTWHHSGESRPPYDHVSITLPPEEKRVLLVNDQPITSGDLVRFFSSKEGR